ncbi:hypothetical protein ARMGADRAFT_1037078 [Armillaria gallica]|uniref:Uncharacterized protein n=1 Tax=Armillaria gallica TaxID=47427 RepID=A0A2H3DAU7_ARMGA|nr:hypothetical protein ARMGADRAFT_1037078 [Armillaria gallica]
MWEASILALLLDPFFLCTALLRTAVARDYSIQWAPFLRCVFYHGNLGFALHSCWLQYNLMKFFNDGGYSDNGLRSENAQALNEGHNNGNHKCFTLDVRFISDAAVVLLDL